MPCLDTVKLVRAEIDAVPGEAIFQKIIPKLRVIQEMHDEGLLSDAEEQSIRRRILEAD